MSISFHERVESALLAAIALVWIATGCTQTENGPAGGPIGADLVEAVGLGEALVHNGVTYPDQRLVLPVNDLPNPYELVWPWGELPTGPMDPGDYDGRASFMGLAEDSDGTLVALSRCIRNACSGNDYPPLMRFSRDGGLLDTWGEGLLNFPHGFYLDPDGNSWVADQGNHQVFKFSSDGELMMTLGERDTPGDPPNRLTQPTDVIVSPDGEIFVTEGHSTAPDAQVNRVSKFTPDGHHIMSWGRTGSGIGEFSVPHAIALDSRGRVFVADRHNNRIQIFDQEGTFLDLWYQFGRPSGIVITADDRIFVADSESFDWHNPGWHKGIRIGSARDGTVEYFIRDLEAFTITHSGPEAVGFDFDGNVYGGVVRRRMLEKHVPIGTHYTPSHAEAPANPAHTHLLHVVNAFGGAPDGHGLAVTVAREANTAMLHDNFAAGDLSDLGSMQSYARDVLHALDPEQQSQGPGLGFGVKQAAEAVVNHIGMAVETEGASEAVLMHGPRVALAARAVATRAERGAEIIQEILAAETAAQAAPLVEHLRELALALDTGVGSDLEEGEVGLVHLEEELYRILIGERLLRVLQ